MVSNITSTLGTLAEKTGWLFYVVDPKKSAFENEEEVPNYINETVPMFLTMVVLELLINLYKGKPKRFRVNDALSSVSHGFCQQTSRIVIGTVELLGYQWLYERRFINLDWSNPVTWWVAAIGADFTYYWFHRGAHEISLIWAAHQVHHSSEDYNLTTALRQSMVQRFFSFGFQQPLALLGVPYPAILVHNQFNLLFQFWIHTEAVTSLGPLEWIFNTASHHRVHHGMNKWCLDKNYAGVLIIWDRMFGTFQQERFDDPIVYGLVDQPQKINVLWHQVFYFKAIIKKSLSMTTWTDSAKALLYGPGWFPGTDRLGDLSSFPDETPQRPKYDPQLPAWMEVYLCLHYFVALYFQQILMVQIQTFSWFSVLMFMAFIFVSLGNIGAFYDGWWLAPLLETARCMGWIAYISSTSLIQNVTVHNLMLSYLSLSTVIWATQSFIYLFEGKKITKIE